MNQPAMRTGGRGVPPRVPREPGAARTFSVGPALCARLEAARAPMYDSRALLELDELKARIEATTALMRRLARRWEEAGEAEESARARAAAEAIESRMRALLCAL